MQAVKERQVAYAVRGYLPGTRHMIVWEYVDGFPVNEYTGYDKGSYLTLYPRRKLMPSTMELRRHSVSIYQTRREF